MATIYAGPGKVVRGSMHLHAEGSGGRIVAKKTDEAFPAVSSMFGTARKISGDLMAEIDLTPFDDWSMIQYLFPFVGASYAGVSGALRVGGDPFVESGLAVPSTIWTPDGRLYSFARSAVTGHPTLTLGIEQPLFGAVKITCLGDLTKTRDSATFLMTASPTESGAAETTGVYSPAGILRGVWVGAFGAVTGMTSIETEDGWTITPEVTYNTHKAQGLTRKMTLANVGFSISGRPVNPTHTQLEAALAGKELGSELSGTDFTLTGPDGLTTVTLKNAQVTMGGFEFGGNPLGTSEIVFHNTMSFTDGVPDPLIEFSAIGGA